MEKKTVNVHALTVHMYTIAIIVLFLLLLVVSVKYVHLKMAVKNYTASAIYLNSQKADDNSQIGDYGMILSNSIANVPSTGLQKYISNLSKNIKRYIVVVDGNKKILASSIPANVGQSYGSDANNIINMTIADGQVRSFDEVSDNYPGGISVLVLPVKNSSGQITGAILLSNAKLAQ